MPYRVRLDRLARTLRAIFFFGTNVCRKRFDSRHDFFYLRCTELRSAGGKKHAKIKLTCAIFYLRSKNPHNPLFRCNPDVVQKGEK